MAMDFVMAMASVMLSLAMVMEVMAVESSPAEVMAVMDAASPTPAELELVMAMALDFVADMASVMLMLMLSLAMAMVVMAVELSPAEVMAVMDAASPTQTGPPRVLELVTAMAMDFVMAMASVMLSLAMDMEVMAVESSPAEVMAVTDAASPTPAELEPVTAMALDFVAVMASVRLSQSMVESSELPLLPPLLVCPLSSRPSS